MNLQEAIALNAGAKITKPNLYESFYPLPFDKYIVFQPISKGSKTYSYWNEALDILSIYLNNYGIKIVQIGQKGEPNFKHTYSIQGTTSLSQTNYLIRNALLNLSVDSFSAHVAGIHDKKLVDLTSNNYSNNVKPYFGTPTNQRVLEPPLKPHERPSFSFEEPIKRIDRIKPEEIAKNVCELLEIKYNYPFQSLYFGHNFNNKVIESVPNQIIDINQFGIQSLVMRMDFEHNEQNLSHQLHRNHCTIITQKTINLDLLGTFRKNVGHVVYELTEDNNPDFCRELTKLGIKYSLISHLAPEQIQKLKEHYYEYGVINRKTIVKPEEMSELAGKNLSNLYYKTAKITLSAGKIYPCFAAYKQDKPIGDLNIKFSPIIDTTDFCKELEYYYLVERVV